MWGGRNRQIYSVSDGDKYSVTRKRHMLWDRGIRSSRGGIISILNRAIRGGLSKKVNLSKDQQ